MRGRTFAWVNLGYRFALHCLRLPARAWSRDAERFRRETRAEGLLPLEAGERAALPETMGCIHCGACTLACPELRAGAASAWAEVWTFVAGASRSIDRPELLGSAVPCTRCGECAVACPADVPVARLVTLARRLAAEA